MNLSKQVESLILQMSVFAKEHNHEFVTPEHLLLSISGSSVGISS